MKAHRYSVATFLAAVFAFVPLAHGQWDEILRRGKEALGQGEATKQIAHFRIKGELAETPVAMPPLFGGEPPMSLKSLLERFKEARVDDDVVAVVIDLQDASFGMAQLEEIHAALRKFAAVDKPVYVHADSLQNVTYAVATGASHISLVPTGDLWLIGLYGESPYLRDLLDKIGVVPDFEQFEDYKSAAEMLMRSGPSDEARKMTDWLLDSLFATFVKRVAEGRNLTEAQVRDLVNKGPFTAEEALKAGLVDSVKHRQDFMKDLRKQYGESVEIVSDYGHTDEFAPPEDPFAFFSFLMQLLNPTPKTYSGPTLAVIYVEGTIQSGAGEASPFGPASGAFSTTIRRALDKAAEEPSVRAVVMRIDSPGGSALASEVILDAAKRVANKKPLVVSMGNVAGSGGYYVACGADTIFADAATITASIGVIGGKLVTTGMWDKLGVNWNAVQRGKMAGIMSSAEPWNEAERAKMRKYMKDIYEVFKNHVVANRGDRLSKPISEIAGGRVFTGEQALELGLIDRVGGLEEAIQFAAQKGGLGGDYEIRVIPEPPSIFDLFAPQADDEFAARTSIVAHPLVQTALIGMGAIDPARVQAVLRALQRIDLLQRESAITMMPFEFVIR
jgi:protease-4